MRGKSNNSLDSVNLNTFSEHLTPHFFFNRNVFCFVLFVDCWKGSYLEKVKGKNIQTGLGFDMQNMLSRFVLRGWKQNEKSLSS